MMLQVKPALPVRPLQPSSSSTQLALKNSIQSGQVETASFMCHRK